MAERGIRYSEANFRSVGSDGTFHGYACLFDVVDQHETTFVKGAFADTIADRVSDIKMLLQHETADVVGAWLQMREDDVGLFVRGKLDLNVARAKEVHSLMQSGALSGLSVGGDILAEDEGEISQFKLQEISIVTFPSSENSQIDSVTMFDTLALDGPLLRSTSDGFLTGYARAARAGVQLYRGHEVGRPDMDVVRVYRPEGEVFDRSSIRSYSHRPVTNDHPPVPVTAENWKKYAVGHIGEGVVRDGEFVRVPLVLMDSAVIRDVVAGKNKLSLGYSTELKWDSGTSPRGEVYDAVQTGIRANHLAIVAAARGGPDLTLGDNDKEITMAAKTIMVDGLPVDVADDRGASIIERHIRKLEESATSLRAKLDEEEKKKKEKEAKDAETVTAAKVALDAKDAEIATMKKQLADATITPAKLDELVKDRAAVVDKAKVLLADKLVVDGKSVAEIRRQVVDAFMGDTAKGWSDDTVTASYNTLVATHKTDDAAAGGGGADRLADSLSNSRRADTVDKLYEDRNKVLQDAWRNKAVA